MSLTLDALKRLEQKGLFADRSEPADEGREQPAPNAAAPEQTSNRPPADSSPGVPSVRALSASAQDEATTDGLCLDAQLPAEPPDDTRTQFVTIPSSRPPSEPPAAPPPAEGDGSLHQRWAQLDHDVAGPGGSASKLDGAQAHQPSCERYALPGGYHPVIPVVDDLLDDPAHLPHPVEPSQGMETREEPEPTLWPNPSQGSGASDDSNLPPAKPSPDRDEPVPSPVIHDSAHAAECQPAAVNSLTPMPHCAVTNVAPVTPASAPDPHVSGPAEAFASETNVSGFERELLLTLADPVGIRPFQSLLEEIRARNDFQQPPCLLLCSTVSTRRTAETLAFLAHLLADQEEENVLLVDANLAEQALTRFYHTLGAPGVCDVFARNSPPLEAIYPTAQSRISIVPTGDDVTGISRDSGRIVNEWLSLGLESWKQYYRRLLIDAGSIDSTLLIPLSAYADASLLLVPHPQPDDRLMAQMSTMMAALPARFLGFVLTDFPS